MTVCVLPCKHITICVFLHVYPFTCVPVCMDAWLHLICLFSAYDELWRGGPLDYLTYLSQQMSTCSVGNKSRFECRWSYMGAAEAVSRKMQKITRWNIPTITSCSICGPFIERELLFVRTRCSEEMCGDDRVIDILSCITYKHTPTYAHKETQTHHSYCLSCIVSQF